MSSGARASPGYAGVEGHGWQAGALVGPGMAAAFDWISVPARRPKMETAVKKETPSTAVC